MRIEFGSARSHLVRIRSNAQWVNPLPEMDWNRIQTGSRYYSMSQRWKVGVETRDTIRTRSIMYRFNSLVWLLMWTLFDAHPMRIDRMRIGCAFKTSVVWTGLYLQSLTWESHHDCTNRDIYIYIYIQVIKWYLQPSQYAAIGNETVVENFLLVEVFFPHNLLVFALPYSFPHFSYAHWVRT